MDTNEIVTIFGAITTAINAAFLGWLAWKRLKPELKKSDAEGESELQEATNLNLEGAKISGQILLDRINELKGELAEEKKQRKETEKLHSEEMQALKEAHESAVLAIEKARKDDIEYFKRRIKELDRELRDYRSWAAKLAKQVVEAKLIPAPFVPSINETGPRITSVRTDLEGDE